MTFIYNSKVIKKLLLNQNITDRFDLIAHIFYLKL